MQRSVEYKATALTAFALARIRLDQALADPSWTAAPKEQTGASHSLPPAVIVDIDQSGVKVFYISNRMSVRDAWPGP
jgi:predicted secreted acid phosphatase